MSTYYPTLVALRDDPQVQAQLKAAHRIADVMSRKGLEMWELGPIADRALVLKLREDLSRMEDDALAYARTINMMTQAKLDAELRLAELQLRHAKEIKELNDRLIARTDGYQKQMNLLQVEIQQLRTK